MQRPKSYLKLIYLKKIKKINGHLNKNGYTKSVRYDQCKIILKIPAEESIPEIRIKKKTFIFNRKFQTSQV